MARLVVLAFAVIAAIGAAIWWSIRPGSPLTPVAPSTTPRFDDAESPRGVAITAVASPIERQERTEGTEPVTYAEAMLARAGGVTAFAEGLVTLVGRVVDEHAAPVAGAQIRAEQMHVDTPHPSGQPRLDPAWRTMVGESGADGRFRVAGLMPLRRHRVKVCTGLGLAAWHLVAPEIWQRPDPRAQIDVGDIVVRPAATVSGRVVDAVGDPLGGAQVWLWRVDDFFDKQSAEWFDTTPVGPQSCWFDPDRRIVFPADLQFLGDGFELRSVEADAAGRYRFDELVPGKWLVTAIEAGAVPASIRFECGTQVVDHDLDDLAVGSGVPWIGTVVDSAGAAVPFAEVRVAVDPPSGGVVGSPTFLADRFGRVRIRGFHGKTACVIARRGLARPWSVQRGLIPGEEFEVQLAPSAGVSVAAIDAVGAPITAAEVSVVCGDDDVKHRMGLGLFGDGRVPLAGRSARLGDGRLRIDDLEPGPYRILATMPDGTVGWTDVELDAGIAHREVAVQVDRSPARVEVVDVHGTPVEAALVHLRFPGSVVMMITDAAGRARVPWIGRGAGQVHAEHPAHGVGEARFDDGQREVRVELGGRAWVVGRIVPAEMPASFLGWTVRLARAVEDVPRQPERTVDVGPDGRFDTCLPLAGRWRVEQLHDGHRSVECELGGSGGHEFQAEDGGTVDLVVLANWVVPTVVGTVRGTVRLGGQPLQAGAIEASGDGNEYRAAIAEGAFDLGEVVAPALELRLRLRDRVVIWQQRIEVDAGAPTEVAIDVGGAAVAGRVLGLDGSPERQGQVFARGERWMQFHADLEDAGRFRFPFLPEGRWTLTAESQQRSSASLECIVSSAPIDDLELRAAARVVVTGLADIRGITLATGTPRWIEFRGPVVQWVGLETDDRFRSDRLLPGRYALRLIHRDAAGKWQSFPGAGEVVVPSGGSDNLLLEFREQR